MNKTPVLHRSHPILASYTVFFISFYCFLSPAVLTYLLFCNGIYYTGSHLYVYINYHILTFFVFRGGEEGVEMRRTETLEPQSSTGVMNQGSRMNVAGRKEPFVAISSRDLTSLAARTMINRRKQISTPEMSMLIPESTPIHGEPQAPWRSH